MYEIYEKHADRYHELVSAEDHQANLPEKLHEILDWRGLSVLEGGVGTGRVTRHYIEDASAAVCCDRSRHMLDFAQDALGEFRDKITFVLADNRMMSQLPDRHDVFIEGWSFGHAAVDCSTRVEIEGVAEILLRGAAKNLRPGGAIVLIESLGTNVDVPAPPDDKLATLYERLEVRHGFAKAVIRTDYRFESNEDAVRVMGFFFGERMVDGILRRKSPIIPEWTGVWTKTV